MDAFQVFRLVLGLIASFFLLYFMIYYSTVYSSMQEDTQRMMITENFRKAVNDVYATGTSITYDDFSRLDFDLIFDGSRDPAVLSSKTGQSLIRRTLVFVPGGELAIKKESIDLGWHRFGFVEALPEMTILLNFRDSSQAARDLARSLVSMFPNTVGSEPSIRFGFCSGAAVEKPCGGAFCEGYSIASAISGAGSMSPCTAEPGQYRIVTISGSCSGSDEGVCIETPGAQGYGHATVNSTSYLHKNLLDLMALIAGSGESTPYGPMHDSLFHYVNREFAQELAYMAELEYHRSALIDTKLPAGSEAKKDCGPHYDEFRAAMQSIKNIASQEGYYTDGMLVASLMEQLSDASDSYTQLVNLGCEYLVEP